MTQERVFSLSWTKYEWKFVLLHQIRTIINMCFAEGTIVLTDNGYKTIEEISVGDNIMTHKNVFRQCVNILKTETHNELLEINAMSFYRLNCDKEQEFYIRRLFRYGHKWIRAFHEPEWGAAKDLDKNCYLGYAINTKEEIPIWEGSIDNRWGHHRQVNALKPFLDNGDFWYLMGRYVGDGWRRDDASHKAIIIVCNERDLISLKAVLDLLNWNYTEVKEGSVKKITIYSRELCEFVRRFGYKAYGKFIDNGTLNLPVSLLKRFIDGLIESDGCYNKKTNHWHLTTVSRTLAISYCQAVAKVYHSPLKVNMCIMPQKTTIEGRIVNQRDMYIVRFKKEPAKQDKAFYENGYIWFPITSISQIQAQSPLYSLEIQEDKSFTANGAIVKGL